MLIFHPMRKKVDAIDYKYFIEPNIPSTSVTDDMLYELKSILPELKLDRYFKYTEKYNISDYDAKILSKNREVADYFEKVIENSDIELSVNFVTTTILSIINKLNIKANELFITPSMLTGVINYVKSGKMSMDAANKLIYKAIDEQINPNELIKKESLVQINDKEKLLELINACMQDNSEIVRQYVEDDNKGAINFFIGQVMKRSNRQANPNISRELIIKELERRKNNG